MFERIQDWQRAVDNGTIWHLEGAMGRQAMAMIDAGELILGPFPSRDYWGNYIPSRSDVKAGTKGSVRFCIDRMGQDYAAKLVAVTPALTVVED